MMLIYPKNVKFVGIRKVNTLIMVVEAVKAVVHSSDDTLQDLAGYFKSFFHTYIEDFFLHNNV